jgi:hypothetical protein
MKRFLWIVLIFGGGIVALMAAALVLQEHVVVPGTDLRAPVVELHEAFAAWEYDRVAACTDAVTREYYMQLFEAAHGNDASRRQHAQGVLASMAAFPSIRFVDVKPIRVVVEYSAADGPSQTQVMTEFIPNPEGGWKLRSVNFQVGRPDNAPAGEYVFHADETVSLRPVMERLSRSLISPGADNFVAVMAPSSLSLALVSQWRDDVRAQAMKCGEERLRRMLPETLTRMPRGWRRLKLTVLAPVDDKPLGLTFAVLRVGEELRISEFRCGPLQKSPAPGPAR